MGNVKVGHKSLCELKENAFLHFSDVGFKSFCTQQDKVKGKKEKLIVDFFQPIVLCHVKPFFRQLCFCRRSTNLAKHHFPLPFVLALAIHKICACVLIGGVLTDGRDISDFVCSSFVTPVKHVNLDSFYLCD